jgi:excisionase family DNA binding protein
MENLIFSLSKDELQSFINEAVQKAFKSQPEQKADELLTQKETCEMLNITEPTLIRWKHQNKLTAVKVGRRCYYKRSELMNIGA